MRDDHARFEAAGAQIVVVVKDSPESVRAYWAKHRLPMIGLPDPDGAIAGAYGQEWKLHRLGRMPAQFVVDCQGRIAFAHYGASMADIPRNDDMLPRLVAARTGCAPQTPRPAPPAAKGAPRP